MKKKTLLISSIVLICILAVTGITLAAINATSNEKINEFIPGVLDAPIVEEFDPDTEAPNNKKIVKVENSDISHAVDAYIRVVFVPTFRTTEGTLAADMSLNPSGTHITVNAPGGGTVTLHLVDGWQNNWIYDSGYFFHRGIVAPGETTAVILQSVSVSDTDLWENFQLEVISDAVQSEGGIAERVWGAVIAEQLEEP